MLRYGCAILALSWSLAACSGSGDERSGGSGIVFSRPSVAFESVEGGALPAGEAVLVEVTSSSAAYIVAGFPPEVAVPTWLDVRLDGSGGQFALLLSVVGLAPHGSYSTTVRVAIADSAQKLLGYSDLSVTWNVGPALRANPATVAFSHVVGAAPSTGAVTLGGSTGVAWTATASEGWVTLDSSSGTTPSTVTVGYDPGGLAPGVYTATVSFAGEGASAAVDVTLVVVAAALEAGPAGLAFSGVNGAAIPAKSLSIAMNNGTARSWSASTSAGWLVLDRVTGATPDSVSVTVDPSVGPLASGVHTATITFTADDGGTPLTRTVPVTLDLTRATLTLSPPALVLGGATGRDFSPATAQISLDTGPAAWGWRAATSDGWMTLASDVGTASATPGSVEIAPNAVGLTGGTRTGTVTFTMTVNGDTVTATLPVTFNLEAHQILVSSEGVALATMPGLSVLSRTLKVRDSLGLGAPWSASADQPWLAVTSSGTADGELVVAADPTGLAVDTLHLAFVTVSSSDPGVENAETIRVGLWVGSAAAAGLSVTGSFTDLAIDPVRPYVYAHQGGSSVDAYNLYTGAHAANYAAVGGALAGMAVSGDGSTLYAVDRANYKLVMVDLDSGTVGTPLPLATTANGHPRVAWTRANGRRLVVVSDGTVRDALSGSVVATPYTGTSAATKITVSQDGRVFCAPICNAISYTALGGTVTVSALRGSMGSRDGALSPDGGIVYMASGSPYNWPGYSTASGALVQTLGNMLYYPGNVEVGPDGRIYGGRYAMSSANDVYVYAPNGAELGSLRVAPDSLIDGELRVSGDGLRLVTLSGALAGPSGDLVSKTIPTFP